MTSTTMDSTLGEQKMEYSFSRSIYDQTTLYGRFMHFQRVVNPVNFFLTSSQIQQAKALVLKAKAQEESQGGRPLLLNKKDYSELVKASYIVGSSTSRDTGEEIPRMMRMCAFLPVNIPILFGMLLSTPTTVNTIFW